MVEHLKTGILQLFKADWLVYLPPGLNVENFMLCARSVFYVFCIGPSPAIISVRSIN